MARKKATEETTNIDYGAQVESEILEEFGDGVICSANSIIERPRKIINVSPALDYMLNGGVTQGSWITFTGKPKLGKSTSALHLLGKCQRAGMKAYILNCE